MTQPPREAASRPRAEWRERYGLSGRSAAVITHAPWLAAAVFCLALAAPVTRPAALGLLRENNVVELATFAILVLGGGFGLRFAWRARTGGRGPMTVGFYAAFSLAMLVIGMEEIAWGQWLIGFETPEALRTINVQRELTLHNIRGLQGRSEYLRLAFGLGGLTGVGLSRCRRFREIAAPVVLLPWFVVIIALTVPDLVNDYAEFREPLQTAVNKLSELVELLIAGAAALFLFLNHRMLSRAESRPAARS